MKKFPDEVIHYDVTISDGKIDDKFPKDLKLSIIEELIKQNQNIFRNKPVYDAEKNLYSMDELPFKSKVSLNNTLKLFILHRKKKKQQKISTSFKS